MSGSFIYLPSLAQPRLSYARVERRSAETGGGIPRSATVITGRCLRAIGIAGLRRIKKVPELRKVIAKADRHPICYRIADNEAVRIGQERRKHVGRREYKNTGWPDSCRRYSLRRIVIEEEQILLRDIEGGELLYLLVECHTTYLGRASRPKDKDLIAVKREKVSRWIRQGKWTARRALEQRFLRERFTDPHLVPRCDAYIINDVAPAQDRFADRDGVTRECIVKTLDGIEVSAHRDSYKHLSLCSSSRGTPGERV